jgi:NADPH:quinone reductase-like Zn-dependent oxidoreductase
MQKGRRCELGLSDLLARRGTVTGTLLRSRPADEKARIVADTEQHVWPLVADGRVRPVVHARIPFAEAQSAHDLLESGEAFGKVLLVP